MTRRARLYRWWGNPRIPVSPLGRLRIAWAVFVASIVGWPASHVWVVVANGVDPFEQFVLALSWFAITATAWDVISTSDVRAEQEGSR